MKTKHQIPNVILVEKMIKILPFHLLFAFQVHFSPLVQFQNMHKHIQCKFEVTASQYFQAKE